jgi:hypothetical protein
MAKNDEEMDRKTLLWNLGTPECKKSWWRPSLFDILTIYLHLIFAFLQYEISSLMNLIFSLFQT